MLEVSKVVPQ